MGDRVGIIGAGRWGTTLAILFSEVGHQVILFCLAEELEYLLSHRRSQFLEGHPIPECVELCGDRDRVRECRYIFVAVPGKHLKSAWEFWKVHLATETIVINASKMIDLEDGRLILPHDIIDTENFVHFASAAFPEGVLDGSPTQGTVYGGDGEIGREVQLLAASLPIKPYTSTDLIGGEIGSALKNVIAIACGIACSLGYDDMTQATIFSRGGGEIARLASQYGARQETFGPRSTFLADLEGTCRSRNSRNFKAGLLLGKGKSRRQVEEEIHGVIEGFHCLDVLTQLEIDLEAQMPISWVVSKIISGRMTLREAVLELFSRPLKSENE